MSAIQGAGLEGCLQFSWIGGVSAIQGAGLEGFHYRGDSLSRPKTVVDGILCGCVGGCAYICTCG